MSPQVVTAIVPAYNEEKRIRQVLRVLTASPFVDEVICIDDGSRDKTPQIVASIPDVILIKLAKNSGKAYAIARGLQKAKGDVVIFIDADISGLTNQSLKRLITPVLQEGYDAVIGYRSNIVEKLAFKPLSGERAYMKKHLMPFINTFQKKGYGLELYLNYLYRHRKVKVIFMENVSNISKYNKQKYNIAIKQHVISLRDMFGEILKSKDPAEFFYYAYLKHFYVKKKEKKIT